MPELTPTYKQICRQIADKLDGQTVGDAGQLEIINGDYCFVIDYRVCEYGLELCCAMMFYKGDEIRLPWLDWDFTEAKEWFFV